MELMASAGARAYNGGLGAEPPVGGQGRRGWWGFVLKTLIFRRICYGFAWNDVLFESFLLCLRSWIHSQNFLPSHCRTRTASDKCMGCASIPTEDHSDRANAIRCCVRLSVAVCLSLFMTLCIVAKRCVLEQKLLLTAYRNRIMRNRLVPKWTTLAFVQRSY